MLYLSVLTVIIRSCCGHMRLHDERNIEDRNETKE